MSRPPPNRNTTAAPPPPRSADEIPGIAARAAKSGAAMFVAKSVRFGFLLLVNFVLINLLLPADFGLVRYVLLVVGIANLLNEMGLTTAIVQHRTLEMENLWSLALISSLWGLCLYSVIFLSAPLVARYFAVAELTTLLRVGALIIPAAGISTVQRALMRRRMEFVKLAIVEMSAAVFSSTVSVVMAVSGCGVWSILAGYLLFEGSISVAVLVVCKVPLHPIQSFKMLRPLLFFGVAIIVSRVVDYILCNAPFFLIGKVIGREGLGLFSVAYDIAMFPQVAILAVLGVILVSTFSRIQSDDGKTATGLSQLLLFGSLATMPVLVMMVVMPEELLRVICILKKDSAWIEAAPLLRWLALTGITYVFTTFSASIWLSRGKIIESIAVSVVMCATIIVAITVGVRWGLQGICIAIFVRAVIVLLPYVYINYRLTRVPVGVYLGALVPSLVAGGTMALVVLGVQRLFSGETPAVHLATLFSGALFGVGAYGAIFWFFFHDSAVQLGRTIGMLLPRSVRRRFS